MLNTPILVIGATGYIGGEFLARFFKHPDINEYEITCYVRSADKAKLLESKFGVHTAVGSFRELEKIEILAENAHIIINLGDSDDDELTRAFLRGLHKRHEKLGDVPIFIHTSGTGTLTDSGRGVRDSDIIYSDLNIEQIKSIPDTAVHRNVDGLIAREDAKGYFRGYIIVPSTVYAIAKNPLVEAGIANAHSVQIPMFIRAALKRKRAGMVGLGKGTMLDIHIEDLSELYIVVFDAIAAATAGHGWEGFYFAENGEHNWYQIARAIGEAMLDLRLTDNAEPTSFKAPEELVDAFGLEEYGWYHGCNGRARADRARALGWKAKYTTADMLASVRPEVEYWAKRHAEGSLTGRENKLDESWVGVVRQLRASNK
ncbi:NAD(P)-binding protein [Epithele typhae]|uniref:NAD(P)-binding protein n=1 Tax=Epithele typhae TaxID=378194 RepID=UPI0020073F35|nr:NAD(P)-binding protein [Epithele typhae]KAH9945011.1 NAD(P)-binding protein [Epithele typhae]